VGASERDEFLRVAWRALVAEASDARRFVFVDECSTNTSLSPTYGWARRGQRVCFEVPRNWGANVTLLSSMSIEGMGPSLAVEGPTTREVFEAYVEKVLAPELSAGQIVVMDNLSSHKGPRVPIRRGTHLFSAGYPALHRGGATVVGFSRGRTQRTCVRLAERHHDARRAGARPCPPWTLMLSSEHARDPRARA
jgi:hypothetical protein